MPQDFARDMILLYSREGDVVWDGCCGSGTVPKKANQMGRKGVGSDVNPIAIKLSKSKDPEGCYWVCDARKVVNPYDTTHPISLIISSLPFGLNIWIKHNRR